MTQPTIPVQAEPAAKEFNADRVGVVLSVLCAIHCAVTPFLLILLPTFGKIWSHPASHWGMALFVVPIAVVMLTTGYRRHRRRAIIATGVLGIVFVIVGAILPYVETSPPVPPSESAAVEFAHSGEAEDVFTYTVGESEATVDEEVFVYPKGEELPEASCSSCAVDNCCPSLVSDAEGNLRLHVPPASIVTTLGGIFLVITHVGNLCACPSCRRRKI